MKYYECPNCFKHYALQKSITANDTFYCDDCGSYLSNINLIEIKGESRYMRFYRWCICFAISTIIASAIIAFFIQSIIVLFMFMLFALIIYAFGMWIKSMIGIK